MNAGVQSVFKGGHTRTCVRLRWCPIIIDIRSLTGIVLFINASEQFLKEGLPTSVYNISSLANSGDCPTMRSELNHIQFYPMCIIATQLYIGVKP